MNEIRIEEGDEYVEIKMIKTVRIGDRVGITVGYDFAMCMAELSLPKALELHKAMGKMLDIKDRLDGLLKITKKYCNDKCRYFETKRCPDCGVVAAIKAAEEK